MAAEELKQDLASLAPVQVCAPARWRSAVAALWSPVGWGGVMAIARRAPPPGRYCGFTVPAPAQRVYARSQRSEVVSCTMKCEILQFVFFCL